MIDLVALPGVPQPTSSWARRWAAATAQSDGTPIGVDNDVRRLVSSGWVEEIVVRSDDPSRMLASAVDAGRLAGRRVRVESVVDVASLPPALAHERWARKGDSWVLTPPRRPRLQLFLKRVIDIAGAAILLTVLSPVLLIIAVAVRLTSDGPILYPWRVLGENGRPFVGYKFRTMVRDADELKGALMHLNERTGPVFKITNDPRVTRIGRWLRKHSLDELPQLWSVLVGDMSLVGPRPPGPHEYVDFELWQMRKMSVKPGMTCIWQVEGRATVSNFADWARLDLHYIDNWSLWKDVAILFKTAGVVVRGTGS